MEEAKAANQQANSQPHQNRAPENFCKWTGEGTVRVVDEVRIQTPPDFLTEYKTGQTENTTHNKKIRLISWLTYRNDYHRLLID